MPNIGVVVGIGVGVVGLGVGLVVGIVVGLGVGLGDPPSPPSNSDSLRAAPKLGVHLLPAKDTAGVSTTCSFVLSKVAEPTAKTTNPPIKKVIAIVLR